MEEPAAVIEMCHACGSAMDVTAVGPFSNVACPNCGEHNRVKRIFGPYFLERRHSFGGMSTVFIARDLTLDREVALKILNEQWCADEKRISAFVEEARLTASFTHPNVVRVFRTGWAFGRFYIAMELVPGHHLEHWIRERGRIPEVEALTMAIQVSQGLKAAQTAGLIHRDMKPGNILLDEHGSAKIVDFGLALVTQGGSAQAQELWATPYYVPPEAVEGLPETFRSDMYAFGATLYHALAGVPPCAEESMATDKLREAKKLVRPLQREEAEISNATCRVVNRAMAYEPENRFNSYDEMISLLQAARQQLLAGNADFTGRQAGRPWAKVLIGITLVALTATAGWWFTRPSHSSGPAGGKSPDPAPAVSEIQEGKPTATPDIARRYQEAREDLIAGNHTKAAGEFAAMRDDDTAQEPTATWAGVEATLAAALSGDMERARQESSQTTRHVQKRFIPDPMVNEKLIPALEKFRELPAFPGSAAPLKTKSGSELLLAMLCGMKNWEQGSLEDALPYFQAVTNHVQAPAGDWSRYYREMAGHYLADHALLTDPAFNGYPATAKECRMAIQKLESFLPRLQTQGRARFNIRAWQLDLAKQAKRLEMKERETAQVNAATPSPEESPQVVFSKVREFGAAYDFKAAATYLKSQAVTPMVASLMDAVLSADQLITSLTDDLRKTPAILSLELRSGTRIASLSADEEGNLTAMDALGKSAKLTWTDLTPDAVIALHRNSVKGLKNEAEITLRHESAIYFDWLSGNRTRASNTADRFSLINRDFKRRWQDFIITQPD